jgi:hypothetical protein
MNAMLLAYLPFTFAVAFAIFGGVTYGLPAAALLRDQLEPAGGRSNMIWAWESVLLLLAVAMTATIALYPEGLTALLPELETLWVVTGVLIVLRALLVVLAKIVGHGSEGWRWALAAVSLSIPVMLIQNVTVLLTSNGTLLEDWPLAAALGALAVFTTLALWSGYYYRPGQRVREIARRSYLGAALTAAVVLPVALLMEPAVLDGRSLWSVGWQIAAALVVGGGLLMWPDRLRYFAASVALVVGVGFSLMAILMPYLARPGILLEQASTDGLTQLMIAAGYVAVSLVLVPSVVLVFDWWTGKLKRA